MLDGKTLTDFINLFSPRFNAVYSRDNLPKTIAYVINLDEYTDAGTHWIALYVKDNKVIYFDYFAVIKKMSSDNLNLSSSLNLNEIAKFRLDEINKVKEYLNNEINERKIALNKVRKYVVIFDYANKIFITLSASFGTLSIVSHATVVGLPVGISGASLTLICTLSTGIVKKMLSVRRKKKKSMIKSLC